MDGLASVGQATASVQFFGTIIFCLVLCICGGFMLFGEDNKIEYTDGNTKEKKEAPFTYRQLGGLLWVITPLILILGYLQMTAVKSNKQFAALQGASIVASAGRGIFDTIFKK